MIRFQKPILGFLLTFVYIKWSRFAFCLTLTWKLTVKDCFNVLTIPCATYTCRFFFFKYPEYKANSAKAKRVAWRALKFYRIWGWFGVWFTFLFYSRFRAEKSPFDGQHRRPSRTGSSLQRATCGAMVSSCGRWCHMASGHIGRCLIKMWVSIYKVLLELLNTRSVLITRVI